MSGERCQIGFSTAAPKKLDKYSSGIEELQKAILKVSLTQAGASVSLLWLLFVTPPHCDAPNRVIDKAYNCVLFCFLFS